jgi:hypothetical protein
MFFLNFFIMNFIDTQNLQYNIDNYGILINETVPCNSSDIFYMPTPV